MKGARFVRRNDREAHASREPHFLNGAARCIAKMANASRCRAPLLDILDATMIMRVARFLTYRAFFAPLCASCARAAECAPRSEPHSWRGMIGYSARIRSLAALSRCQRDWRGACALRDSAIDDMWIEGLELSVEWWRAIARPGGHIGEFIDPVVCLFATAARRWMAGSRLVARLGINAFAAAATFEIVLLESFAAPVYRGWVAGLDVIREIIFARDDAADILRRRACDMVQIIARGSAAPEVVRACRRRYCVVQTGFDDDDGWQIVGRDVNNPRASGEDEPADATDDEFLGVICDWLRAIGDDHAARRVREWYDAIRAMGRRDDLYASSLGVRWIDYA